MIEQVRTHPKSIRAWLTASRPKSLPAGVIPILAGAFLTNISLHELNWFILISALLAVLCITISTNLINDALDAKKGADTEKRLGPIRVTKSGLLSEKEVLAAGFGFLFLTVVFALPMIFAGGLPITLIIICSLICSYLYTGGPYPFSYNGLAEVFILIFYGWNATMISYFLQVGYIDLNSFVAATQVGSFAMALCAINNLRDFKEDSTTGKSTLTVKYGEQFGKKEISFLLLFPYFLCLYWYSIGHVLAFLMPFSSLFIAFNIIRGIWLHSPSRLYNRYFGETSLLLSLFGVLLILGFRIG